MDAAVQEFNGNWITGMDDYATGPHWQDQGEKLTMVLRTLRRREAVTYPDHFKTNNRSVA